MKKKSLILSFVLGFLCVVPVFGLFGCGASPQTLKKNFEALDKTYETYSTIFVEKNISGVTTDHAVDFGAKVNGYVSQKREGFDELDELYNLSFAISNQYIERYRGYICELQEKDLSKEAKNALDTLNNSLTSFDKQIKNFVKERASFVQYFEQYEGVSETETSTEVYLRRFKESFGRLLEKNIKFSTDLANAVEATKIFDLLKQVEAPLSSDTGIVKEYVRAKMLHLFTDFEITEFSNKMTWSVQAQGDCKSRIDTLIGGVGKQYDAFKTQLIYAGKEYNVLSKEEFSNLFDFANEFLLEAEAYSKALTKMNFYDLAVNYGNNLKKYKEKNKFAEVYLQKMEQFVSITLPNFIQNFAKKVYKVA